MNEVILTVEHYYEAIIFMKIGYHTDEEIKKIIDRKIMEEKQAGFFFWGYGGSLCHPTNQVIPFIEKCKHKKVNPKLLMTFTQSKFRATPIWQKEYSVDKKVWRPLPSGVKIKGSKYALVCKNIKKVNMKIDLNSYVVAVGPKIGTPLGEYIRYRVDKACAFKSDSRKNLPERFVDIVYIADIVYPYAVFVR